MSRATDSYRPGAGRLPGVQEVDSPWIATGPGCAADTIAIAAAARPSIGAVVLGAIPRSPKANPRDPVLAAEVGDDVMQYWYAADGGPPSGTDPAAL